MSAPRAAWLAALWLAVALAFVGVAAQAQVYRSVDKDGTVRYSDQPSPGAQQMDMPKAQTYTAPPQAPVRVTSSQPADAKAPGMSCEITSPSPDETFQNAYSVTVSFRGPEGYVPTLLLDGARADARAAGNSLVVSEIARGTHQAVVSFANASSGAEACRTAPVTFHVHQPTLYSPARPNSVQPRPTPLPAPRPTPR